MVEGEPNDKTTDERRISLSMRQLGSGALYLLATLVFLAAARINPWVGALFKGARAPNYADVQLSFFIAAMVMGFVIVWFAYKISKGKSWADGAALLVVMIAGLVLADRYVLTHVRLSLWKHDSELHYRHRPGARRAFGQGWIEGVYSINRWGHHDTDFPLQKPAGEFRALMLGDSVTMGHGVDYEETFSAHLEKRLREKASGYSSFEVINTGVHGYSTYQELQIFEESLPFDPDFVALGFCLNDVVEPFVVNEEYGGVGLDYHGVSQTPSALIGWLSNETGVGRLLQTLASRSKSVEKEKLKESYNVRRMAQSSASDPALQEAWRITLASLDSVYALARGHDKPFVLLVFPFTFQLLDESMREPQRILMEHAARHGVDALDFTPIFARLIFDDPEHLEFLRARGYSNEDINHFYMWRIEQYFWDEDHLTSEGHEVVAEELFEYLVAKNIIKRE